MMNFSTKQNKQKSKPRFPEAPLISDKNKKEKPLSEAEKAWIDLIEYSETPEIRPTKTDKK